MSKPGTYIRLILSRSTKAIESFDRKSIADTGLNLTDFGILEALLHKGPLPINTIGEKILLTSGPMTTATNRLEDRGLVKRIQDPSDGRCFYLHLTKSGHQLINKAFKVHASNLERIFDVLSPKERSELVRLLKKVGLHAQNLK